LKGSMRYAFASSTESQMRRPSSCPNAKLSICHWLRCASHQILESSVTETDRGRPPVCGESRAFVHRPNILIHQGQPVLAPFADRAGVQLFQIGL
jgi:hypothetical protein